MFLLGDFDKRRMMVKISYSVFVCKDVWRSESEFVSLSCLASRRSYCSKWCDGRLDMGV